MYFLFLAYDLRWEVHLDAVQALVKCLAGIVDAYTRAVPDGVDEESHLAMLRHAFLSKVHGASLTAQHGALVDKRLMTCTTLTC